MGGLSRIVLVVLLLLSIACGSSVADSENPAPSVHTSDQPLPPEAVNTGGAVQTKGLLEVNSIVDRLSADGLRIGSLKGYVQNDDGKDCWYTQSATADDSVSYFYKSLTGSDTLMIFDDVGCMTPHDSNWDGLSSKDGQPGYLYLVFETRCGFPDQPRAVEREESTSDKRVVYSVEDLPF